MKITFLHGDLEEEIYMEQLEGFVVKGKENMFFKLRKRLYGLKQAPRQWYRKSVNTPFIGHFKLSSKQCPTSENEKEEM